MLQRFWDDDEGGELVEYALVVGLLVVIGLAATISLMNAQIAVLFNGVLTQLKG